MSLHIIGRGTPYRGRDPGRGRDGSTPPSYWSFRGRRSTRVLLATCGAVLMVERAAWTILDRSETPEQVVQTLSIGEQVPVCDADAGNVPCRMPGVPTGEIVKYWAYP